MMIAPPEKNNKVNQSIKAEKLRLSVGSAKVAKQANEGNDSNSVRSGFKVDTLAMTVTKLKKVGITRCWCHR